MSVKPQKVVMKSILFLCVSLAVPALAFSAPPAPSAGGKSAVTGDYAIVISATTLADPAWKAVVDALVNKHGLHHDKDVIVFSPGVIGALPHLREKFPKYSCFVATPKEVTQQFVGDVHRVTRQLDEDPYTDTQWGILTGYDASNALDIARYQTPLSVEKVASGTEIALECCTEGLWYDELVKNKYVRKDRGGEAKQLQGPDDTTQRFVEVLSTYEPDLFVTSGHATEQGWQIGFRYRNGFLKSKAGQLYGEDTQKRVMEIDSPNPKVYLPIGNCLMGNINGPDAMALSWLNDAGVKQMIGYTVPTWYGYQGWGVLDYFVEQPGRYTLTEAFFANHHALIHRLQLDETSASDQRGLAFDRDVVAFYGDPAWTARMADGKLAYGQRLSAVDGVYTFEIEPLLGKKSFDTVNANGAQRGGRPFVQFLKERISDVEIIEGHQWKPVITDDFVLIPRPTNCDPKQSYRLTFKAKLRH
jgi:hypothetical protein